MEPVAPRELRAVVERDGSPHGGREGAQHLCHGTGNMVGAPAGEADGDEQARMALMESKDSLAMATEEHQIGLPVARRLAIGGLRRALSQGASFRNRDD